MTRVRPTVPWALLLPVATTALFLLWWTHREERAGAPPFTPLVLELTSVEGWGVAADLGAGRGRLSARLWPLHSEPDVQAFDAAALARRLELAAGEPWLAELSWTVPPDAPASAATELLEVGALAVLDGSGEALVPLVPNPQRAAQDAPADPLRVLLAPPSAGLAPDQSLSVVLWRRAPRADRGDAAAPGGAPRLVGLAWSGGDALAALELEPMTHALDALPRDLARFEAERGEDRPASGVR